MLHGLSESDIHWLFIVGFSSACLFGPISGILWDRFGRKNGILVYGLFYGVSCVITAHGQAFGTLILDLSSKSENRNLVDSKKNFCL